MNTFSALKAVLIGSLAAVLFSPTAAMAETTDNGSAVGHSLIHRVSHSLASSKEYTSEAAVGYKWGKAVPKDHSEGQWSGNSSNQGGYKWGNSIKDSQSASPTYAGATSYQYGSMSFSHQSAYRWGMRSFADQSAYRWGMRSFADQSAYRWGMRSFSNQSAYRWGMR